MEHHDYNPLAGGSERRSTSSAERVGTEGTRHSSALFLASAIAHSAEES